MTSHASRPTQTDDAYDPRVPLVRRAMGLASAIVDHHYPGARFQDERSYDELRPCFGVNTPQGCLRVFSSLQGVAPGNSWWMRLNTAVGLEIPDIKEAMRWTNERNTQILMGRYYVSVAHHGNGCAVIWEHLLYSGLLESLGGQADRPVVDYVAEGLQWGYGESVEMAPQLQAEMGGRLCPQGQPGLDSIRGNLL